MFRTCVEVFIVLKNGYGSLYDRQGRGVIWLLKSSSTGASVVLISQVTAYRSFLVLPLQSTLHILFWHDPMISCPSVHRNVYGCRHVPLSNLKLEGSATQRSWSCNILISACLWGSTLISSAKFFLYRLIILPFSTLTSNNSLVVYRIRTPACCAWNMAAGEAESKKFVW